MPIIRRLLGSPGGELYYLVYPPRQVVDFKKPSPKPTSLVPVAYRLVDQRPINRPFLGLYSVKNIVNDKRPVNLDITAFQFPLAALVSITHRVTGVILFVAVGILLCLLDASLASEASFNELKECLSSFFVRLIVWLIASALIYHSVVGVKHLAMDLGYGESLEGGQQAAKIAAGVSGLLIAFAALWIIF